MQLYPLKMQSKNRTERSRPYGPWLSKQKDLIITEKITDFPTQNNVIIIDAVLSPEDATQRRQRNVRIIIFNPLCEHFETFYRLKS